MTRLTRALRWATPAGAALAVSAQSRAQQVTDFTKPLLFKPESEASWPSAGQWFVAALACALLLAALIWLLRRRGSATLPWGTQRSADVVVLERTPLTAHTQLVLVRYAGRRLLLSVGSTGATCLRDDPIDGAGRGEPALTNFEGRSP